MITCTATFGTEADAKEFALVVSRHVSGGFRKGKTFTVKAKTPKSANGLLVIAKTFPSFKSFKAK